WIGANDIDKPGLFVWSSNNNTFVNTRWSRGQPDNKYFSENNDTENCVLLWKSSNFSNDAICARQYSFVCQSDPCDTFLPGSLYGQEHHTCYKYYESPMTWSNAQKFCLSLNSHLVEPENDVLQTLQVYLYNRTAWIGGGNRGCTTSFQWYIRNTTIPSSSIQSTSVSGCTTQGLLWKQVNSSMSWTANDSQESHGFVCQSAITVIAPRLYLAVLPQLTIVSPHHGLLQVTSGSNDVIYVRFNVSNYQALKNFTVLPLVPRRAVSFYLEENTFLSSTDVYSCFVEVNSSQPVNVVLYIVSQSTTSSTLVYPVNMYTSSLQISKNYLPISLYNTTIDNNITLSITSMSTYTNKVNVEFRVQGHSKFVFFGDTQMTLSNVENISVLLEALYQTLHINLQSNLYGTYLYSAYPVMVTMGTVGDKTMDSSLDVSLPLDYIGQEYFIFTTSNVEIFSTKNRIKCQAVYDWTLINITAPNTSFLLKSVGDTYETNETNDQFYYINGNTSFYVYVIISRHSDSHQELCVTTLLPPSVWRDEYSFARVSNFYTVYMYIIAEIRFSSDILTNDTSVQWTCQHINESVYLGCTTKLPTSVTYLQIQVTNKTKFGAYLLAHDNKAICCHTLGISDIVSPNIEHFQHDKYLRRIRSHHEKSCGEEQSTTESTSQVSIEFSSQVTSEHFPSLLGTTIDSTYAPSDMSATTDVPTTTDVWTTHSTGIVTQMIQDDTKHVELFPAVDYHKLSSYQRNLISAPDERTSAFVIGMAGVIFLSAVMTLILLPDLVNIIRFSVRLKKTRLK
ncbi:C-type mannose receptor 2, partial [Biomphalaria pfeifferi]